MIARTLAVVLILTTSGLAEDRSHIEHSLKSSYETHIFALQNFYSDSHLKYDASGTLLGTGHPGPWTLGYVVVHYIQLTRSSLEFHGKRVAVQIQTETNHHSYVIGNEDVTIDIAAPATSNEATLRSAIEHVFYAPGANFASVVPDYWRDLLAGHVVRRTTNDTALSWDIRGGCPLGISMEAPPEAKSSGAPQMVCNGLTIYTPTKGVVEPPTVLKSSDPKYSEFARQAKYQGTTVLWLVVDDSGHPQMIRIVRALGMGLDDAAVDAVRDWTFRPAVVNSHRVAADANIFVNFRLY